MLLVNLNVLLAERNLRISKVSKDTGISRTTLTALCNNLSQGIQFETLNTLCSYLSISPTQFFTYLPLDYTLYIERQNANCSIANFSITANKRTTDCAAFIDIETDATTSCLYITLSPSDEPEDNSAFLQKFIEQLPPIVKDSIEDKICNIVGEDYENYSLTFIWDI